MIRWAIFSIKDIDKSYNDMDMEQVWAEAIEFARHGNTEFTEEMKKHCISLSSKHQIVTATDELISQYFELNEDCSQSAYELYECLPYDMKKLFGTGTGALSKLGKALTRVFGKSQASYKSGGITKWRVRFKTDRRS